MVGKPKGIPRAVKSLNLDLRIILAAEQANKNVRDFVETAVYQLQDEVKKREASERAPDLYTLDELKNWVGHYNVRLQQCQEELTRREGAVIA